MSDIPSSALVNLSPKYQPTPNAAAKIMTTTISATRQHVQHLLRLRTGFISDLSDLGVSVSSASSTAIAFLDM